MPNKKKLFNKGNSVKFLLLHGNTQAVNADGERLENILVPVSKNYKPGTSLLMSNIGAISNAELPDVNEEDPDLEKIMNAFEDSDTEVVVEELPSKLKHLNFSETSMSNIGAISNAEPPDVNEEDPDLEKIMNAFEDSDTEVLVEELPSELEHLNFSETSNNPLSAEDYDEDAGLTYDFFDDQFADASDNSYEDSDEEEDDTIDHPNCPETIKMYNAKFREVLKEYDDDHIGALDNEDTGGYLNPSEAFERYGYIPNKKENVVDIGEFNEDLKQKILISAEDSGDEKIVEIVTEKPLEFDCESILSTYSNIYNHPAVIKEEKVKKIQVPNNPLKKRLTKSQLKRLPDEKDDSDDTDDESDDNVSVCTSFTVRVKGETPEQRRQRKKEFKEAKRESRILKKENKLAFKHEMKLQKAQQINVQRNAGVRLL